MTDQTREVPRSRCRCGHTGDGPNSEHFGTDTSFGPLNNGHGVCKIQGCRCIQFTWACFLEPRHLPRSQK